MASPSPSDLMSIFRPGSSAAFVGGSWRSEIAANASSMSGRGGLSASSVGGASTSSMPPLHAAKQRAVRRNPAALLFMRRISMPGRTAAGKRRPPERSGGCASRRRDRAWAGSHVSKNPSSQRRDWPKSRHPARAVSRDATTGNGKQQNTTAADVGPPPWGAGGRARGRRVMRGS